jgi:hypothetical protein
LIIFDSLSAFFSASKDKSKYGGHSDIRIFCNCSG